jgi:hypothetical protein
MKNEDPASVRGQTPATMPLAADQRGALESAGESVRYRELDVGEEVGCATPSGRPVVVRLEAAGERSVTLRVDGRVVELALGHFGRAADPQPPGHLPNVTETGGVRIVADVTQAFMRGTCYSLSLINLQKDARLYVGPAGGMPLPGRHVFPVPDFDWHYADNWLRQVPYGWHLGIDIVAERGHPIVSVADGVVHAVREFVSGRDPDDYWGTGVMVLGDDRVLYLYMHPDRLAPFCVAGRRIAAGDVLGYVGKSGFETMPFAPHLHFEMVLARHPEKFTFRNETEPEYLPTPNRVLPVEVEGHIVNPYPYLVDWYGGPA